MTYNIQVGSGGYLGWKMLERTMERQESIFLQSLPVREARDYFSKKMPNVKTADELVNDRKLLEVALRAFGLDNDIKNKFFIKRILEADPDDKTSLVNRMTDKRYLKLNEALSFGGTADGSDSGVDVTYILDSYNTKSLERNIGERHQEIELALNARRELSEISRSGTSEDSKWYQILASKPLRKIFEGAYGLGDKFSLLPIDRQLSEMKDRTKALTGSSDIEQFKSPDAIDDLIKQFLLRIQISVGAELSPYSVALAILGARSIK